MSRSPWLSAKALLLLWTALPLSVLSEDRQSVRVSCNAAYNAPCSRISARKLATGMTNELLESQNTSDFLREVTDGSMNIKSGFYPFVVDITTQVLVAHGANASLVGETLSTVFSRFGINFADANGFHNRSMEAARQGGDWVRYIWSDSGSSTSKVAYVTNLTDRYYVGVGYIDRPLPFDLPCSADYDSLCSIVNVQSLLGTALGHLLRSQESADEFEAALFDLSYSDEYQIDDGYYVFMNNYDGVIKAHGRNDSIFGQQFAEVYVQKGLGTWEEGQQLHADFVVAAESNGWVKYRWGDNEDVKYDKISLLVEVEFENKKYYLGVGFKFSRSNVSFDCFETSTANNSPCSFATALALSSHTLAYAISSPSNSTDATFTNISSGNEFKAGDFYVFVYSFDGVCVAHGENPSYVSMDITDVFEDKGFDFNATTVHEQFKGNASQGGGWVLYPWAKGNANFSKLSYIFPITLEGKQYYGGVGFNNIRAQVARFSDTGQKKNGGRINCSMNYGEPCSLVNANAILGSTLADAVLTLESSEKLEQLLQSISTERGKNYSVNDFHVAVFSADANQCIDDLSGCCMAYGGKFEYVNLTWQAILNKQEITSIQGAELHRQLLKKANGGGGWHNYPWSKSTGNAQTKRALVARFRSGNLTYYAVAEYLNSTLPPTCDNCGDGKECTQDDQEFCAQIPDRSAQRLGETFASVFVPVCVVVGVVALIVWYRYRKRMQEQEEELRKRMQEKEEELQRMAEQLREEMRGMWEVVKDLPIQSPGAYAREVQQREGGDSILPHTAALWYWEENWNLVSSHNASTVLRGTRFVCYPREISEVLEESFAEFKNDERSREVLFELSTSNSLTGVQYAVNFQTFKQRNVATGYERTVCREEVPIPIEPEVIGRLPQLPDDIDFSDDGEALLPTFKGQIIQVSKHHISGLWLYGNVLYDPLLNAVHLQSQAADATATALNPLMVNALHDRPTSGWFPRSVTKPADAKALQKLLKNFGGEGADILAPPDTWVTIDNSTSTPYRNGMVEVDAQSEECKAVVTSLMKTMGKRRRFIIVTNVERIQNLPLWQSYAVMRQIIRTRDIDTPHHRINNLNLTDIERECLFHGTCSDVVPKIVTQGFNRAFAGRHAVRYGKGVYFARDASYSSNETFSAPDSDGIQRMFLCRAIVGDWCQGVEGQLTPDAKPHNALELFDSTVDDVSNPSIFVIYHDAQSFPAYLISFRDTRRAT